MKFSETNLEDVRSIIEEAESEDVFIRGRDSDATLLEAVISFSKDSQFKVFKLEDDLNEIVGITSFFPNKHDGQISLGITYIREPYRSKGYGRMIREMIINEARNSGYKKVFTKTWGSNTAMIKMNDKLGFRLIEEVPDDRENGDSTVKFILDL